METISSGGWNGGAELDRETAAANVKPLVDVLKAGYSRQGFFLREGALELNWRLATTEATRQAFFSHRLQAFGLPRVTAQYGVLRDIYFSEGHCLGQNQITRIRGVSSANVTRLIHGLEQAGLVTREANPEDRRSTVVHLTDAGISLCRRLVPAMGEDISNIGNCFTDAELAMLNEFLARLHIHIEAMGLATKPASGKGDSKA